MKDPGNEVAQNVVFFFLGFISKKKSEIKSSNSFTQRLSYGSILPTIKYSLARDDKNGRFGERAPQLTMLAKLAILAIFCQFRQIS